VNEGHTIGVEIALGAYDTDFGFAIGFEKAEKPVPARKTSLWRDNTPVR